MDWLSASATTRSRMPILRRSAATSPMGAAPLKWIMVGSWEVPSPFPKLTQISLLPPLETAQSIFPSRLKSPATVALGMNPAGKVGWNANPGRLVGCEREGAVMGVAEDKDIWLFWPETKPGLGAGSG